MNRQKVLPFLPSAQERFIHVRSRALEAPGRVAGPGVCTSGTAIDIRLKLTGLQTASLKQLGGVSWFCCLPVGTLRVLPFRSFPSF